MTPQSPPETNTVSAGRPTDPRKQIADLRALPAEEKKELLRVALNDARRSHVLALPVQVRTGAGSH